MQPMPEGRPRNRLRAVVDADRATLMRWFGDEAAVRIWGGPAFHFPYTEQSFRADSYWDSLAGFALCDDEGRMCAFGQLYEHLGRVHLARLVVDPERRGEGLGRALVLALLEVGASMWPVAEASLYVYRHNTPALACYLSIGFRITDFPPVRAEMADSCYFLTLPIELRRSTAGNL
jgi:ribosomal protein S18 acetylase RimI-like enzyme